MKFKSSKTFQKNITLERNPLKLPYHIYVYGMWWEAKNLREKNFMSTICQTKIFVEVHGIQLSSEPKNKLDPPVLKF